MRSAFDVTYRPNVQGNKEIREGIHAVEKILDLKQEVNKRWREEVKRKTHMLMALTDCCYISFTEAQNIGKELKSERIKEERTAKQLNSACDQVLNSMCKNWDFFSW